MMSVERAGSPAVVPRMPAIDDHACAGGEYTGIHLAGSRSWPPLTTIWQTLSLIVTIPIVLPLLILVGGVALAYALTGPWRSPF